MTFWLVVLFGAMATAAGDFLSIHLVVIVRFLHISESLAGVTIFAFGNGSTDLFSTLTAMSSGNGGLAISELFGAAVFITTVVLGLVAIVQPFTVDPKSFVGDVVWFILAVSMVVAFLADGRLVLGECLGIIGLYVAFVCFALLRPKANDTPTMSANTNDNHEQHQTLGGSPERSSEDSGRAFESLDNAYMSATAPARIAGTIASERSVTCAGSLQETDRLLPQTAGVHEDEVSNSSALRSNHPSDSSLEPIKWQPFLKIFPCLTSWNEQSLGGKILTVLSLPLLVPIGLTVPMVQRNADEGNALSGRTLPESSESVDTPASSPAQMSADSATLPQQPLSLSRLLAQNGTLCLQVALAFQFLAVVFAFQAIGARPTAPTILVVCLTPLILSALSGFCILTDRSQPRNHLSSVKGFLVSVLSFTTSLTWIYLIATSAVTLLMTLGFILNIPTTILGAIIFAIGNSSNDLVANMAVARRGFPILAASACFGGPMMNMLLGIGGGGLMQVLKARKGPAHSRSDGYLLQPSSEFFVSASSLLIGLGVTLIYAFYNSWRLDQRLGTVLIGIWIISTIGTIGISMARS